MYKRKRNKITDYKKWDIIQEIIKMMNQLPSDYGKMRIVVSNKLYRIRKEYDKEKSPIHRKAYKKVIDIYEKLLS